MHYHTRPLRLMEAHVLLRDGPPISSKRIRFYETNGTSHRSARPPTRRSRHLMEAHARLQDGALISSKRVRFYETNGTSHRSAHPPTRRSRHLMEARPILRDDAFSRTDIKGGQQMHPSGVQFGLSRGLLQLPGGEVLLSDQLLETISAEAHRAPPTRQPPSRAISWSMSLSAPRRTR
jgi:hypothetical protein